jgi:hypothetical protein
MQNITNVTGLRNSILLLEMEQADKGQLLKEQLYVTYESLKPFNYLRRVLNDISSSPNSTDNILGTAMGLISGYLSKKVVIGASGNLLRKLLGSLLQVGVTNVIAQHPDKIKLYGRALLQYFFRKKISNSKNRVR